MANLHEVAITAILIKDGKFLITRRSLNKKSFPGMWTVPGGRLEVKDYINLPKDTDHHWYNVLEKTLRREVREEVGIEITDIEYLTSITTINNNGEPSLIISCIAKPLSEEIKLQEDECDTFAWVVLEEAKKYNLLDGIYDELVMADKKLNGEKSEWRRF